MSPQNLIRNFLFASLAAFVLSACGQPEAAAGGKPVTAPSVDVATVIQQKITDADEFTGRLQAPETVSLMPRVSGYLEQVHLTEGSLVQAGDLLFQIDNRAFVAEVNRLNAQLLNARSQQQLAKSDLARAEKLRGQNAIATELLDARRARFEQANAEVASVQAALSKAQLDLSHTEVRAPISGRVSSAQITAGNFVQAGQSQLTTIVSTNLMYAYFDADEQTYLKYVELAAAGQRADSRSNSPVLMALSADPTFRFRGELNFLDNSVNPQTGTIRARAVFKDPENRLIPGLFARLKLAGRASYDGILIDDKAIGTDLNNKFVLVVDAQQQLQYQPVTLGEKIAGLRVITSGLKANDQIVVNGLQRVRPTLQITPNVVEMAKPAQLSQLQQLQQALGQESATAAQPLSSGPDQRS